MGVSEDSDGGDVAGQGGREEDRADGCDVRDDDAGGRASGQALGGQGYQ